MVAQNPLVSFCVPTYGRAAFIQQTLESALAQTIEDFEVVVVDDCSPDNTGEIVARISDARVRYVRNAENLGVPENLNRSMSLARGQYLVLLEDHDLLEPTYLQETLRVMNRYPSVGFVATGLVVIDEHDVPREQYVNQLPEFTTGRMLLKRLLTRTTCPFSVTTLIRRSATAGISPLFDARYWWYADQGLWLRLAARADVGYVAHALLRFRTRETDHQLNGRDWESALCLDRIRREHWALLHSKPSWRSRWDWLLYEIAKLRRTAMWRGGRMLRGEAWTPEDRRCAEKYLSKPSRAVLAAIGMLPTWAAAACRKAWRWHIFVAHRPGGETVGR